MNYRFVVTWYNDLGWVILDQINLNIHRKLNLNQWKNTDNVLNSFKSIKQKHLYKFVLSNIKEFKLRIRQGLLKKALDLPEACAVISTDKKSITHHTKKSLLFSHKETWIKHENRLPDV